MEKEQLETKLISLLKEVKEIVEKMESKGVKVEITPIYKDFDNIYKMEVYICEPISI